jgi:hypothetical protein
MAEYEAWLTDGRGVRILGRDGQPPLGRNLDFVASRTVNRIGHFAMKLPGDIPRNYVRDDNMVQLWRRHEGGSLRLWRIYFIRKRHTYFEEGTEFLEISGPDSNDILRRRVVAARPGTSVSEKVDTIDDMMKEIVLEAFSDGVNPSPAYGTRTNSRVSIAPPAGAGPMTQHQFPWEKLLDASGGGVLPKLADAASAAGVPVFFDMHPVTVTNRYVAFRFVTQVYQPGRDISNRITFSLALENMANPELVEDAREEENYIYATGQGEGVDQYVEQVYAQNRAGAGVWGRCEGVASDSGQDDDQVAVTGQAALAAGRPKLTFYADPLSVEGTVFGKDWNFGDRVRAVYHRSFMATIMSVTVSVKNGEETVDARLEGEI